MDASLQRTALSERTGFFGGGEFSKTARGTVEEDESFTLRSRTTLPPSFAGSDRRGDVRVLFRPLEGERGRARPRPALQGHPANEEGVLCARTRLRKDRKRE